MNKFHMLMLIMIINYTHCKMLEPFIFFRTLYRPLYLKSFFKIKTNWSLIDLDAIFPMQSSEFRKSLNFGCILKNAAKNPYIFRFSPKNVNFSPKN